MSDELSTFTVLAEDKPLSCSRCGGPIGKRIVVAEWNDVRFGYCEKVPERNGMTKLAWLEDRAKNDFVSGLWLSDLLEVERAAREYFELEQSWPNNLGEADEARDKLGAALAALQEPHQDRYGQ